MSARFDSQFEAQLADWLDEAAHGAPADQVVAAALARTARTRPRPGWLVAGRRATQAARLWAGPVPKVVLVAILVGIMVVAIALVVGSQRKLPAPFGLARNGSIAYESGGHVWVAGPNGESPRQLTFGPTTEVAPVWSRDGTRLAFRRLTADEPASDPGRFQDLVVVDADGSHPITIATAVPFLSNPTWSPDGRFIAYSRSVDPGPDHLAVAAVDGSGISDLGDLGGGAWGPSWAPDGRHIAVSVANQLVVVARDGSDRRVVSHGSYMEVGSQGIAAEWSPDGAMLAFAAGSVDEKRVYLASLDGRPEVPIGQAHHNQVDPSWSPDGSMLAYLRPGRGLGPTVVIADRSGKELRVLLGYYAWCTPVWSPDGHRMIVLDDDPQPTVVRVIDPDEVAEPIELPAPAGPLVNDNVAGSWQRMAP